MDYKAATRVSNLVTSLTDSKVNTLDEAKLKELKELLRTNEQLVSHAHGLITDRLTATHSQTRKLALQLCDLLFARSKAFRRLLTAQFGHFVESTVGHKSDKPLPGPPAAAVELRQKALEVIEKWHEQWGLQYPQVTLAYKYLNKHYKFPEIASRAAAAAAAEAARQQRHQQMLRQRYEAFQLDFPQQQQQMQSLLQQMEECFELLRQPVQHVLQHDEEQPSPVVECQAVGEQHIAVAKSVGGVRPGDGSADVQQQLGNRSPGSLHADAGAATAGEVAAEQLSAAGAAAHSSEAAATATGTRSEAGDVPPDQDWEDVVPDVQQQTPGGEAAAPVENDDGIAGDYDGDELVGDFQDIVPDPAATARQATVLEQLADLAKQAQLLTNRTLLDWLRLLTQLQLGEQQQQQQRQHLRAVVDLRAQLQGALQESANWNIMPIPRAATSASEDQHNRGCLQVGNTGQVAANTPATDAHSTLDLSQLPSRGHQPIQLPQRVPGSQAPAAGHIAFASGLRRSTYQEPPQQQQADVYAGLRDPTAAGRGIYIIPTEVRQAAEEGRWVRHPQTDSSDSEQLQSEAGAAVFSAAHHGRSPAKANQPAAQQQPASTSGNVKQGKGLDAALRQKLAAAAPKLPIAGEDWLLAQHGVSSHGMELYNHWGAVDSTSAISQDRLKELVGYTASYYKPNKKRQKFDEAVARDSGQASPEAGATGHATAANRALASSDADGGPATRAPASPAGARSSIAAGQQTAAPIGTATSGNATALPTPANQGSAQEKQNKAPSHKNSASAHNRAVLAAAHSDEAVAAALQQQLNAEAARAQIHKGRARKPPETKADKLRKFLLGSK